MLQIYAFFGEMSYHIQGQDDRQAPTGYGGDGRHEPDSVQAEGGREQVKAGYREEKGSEKGYRQGPSGAFKCREIGREAHVDPTDQIGE